MVLDQQRSETCGDGRGEQRRMVISALAKPARVERDRKDDVDASRLELTPPGHPFPEGPAEISPQVLPPSELKGVNCLAERACEERHGPGAHECRRVGMAASA
jgi:hypothetical protein